MNKKDDNIKSLLIELQKEQIKLRQEQKEFNEKQTAINKKNRRTILALVFIFLFISGITSVASYTLGANSVEFTPRDANWNVENTQEALDDLFDSVGSALVGSVYSYMGVNVPLGYLACDGSTYNIADYPRLAGHIKGNFGSYNYFGGDGTTTFAVPDLRGEFLRGTGTNSHYNSHIKANEGSGSNVGVHQESTMHAGTGASSSLYISQITTYDSSHNPDAYNNANFGKLKGLGSTWDSSSNGSAFTSRPTNTSVLYIIKY